MTTLLERAQAVGTAAHAGQMYGTEPYFVHLQAVENVLRRFQVADESLYAAAWLHDVVEDTSVPLRALNDEFGPSVAGPVALVTEPKGGTRAERHAVAYPRIRRSIRATMLKLADRIANVEAGGKVDMYRQEYPTFRSMLYEDSYRIPALTAMWAHLDTLMETK